MADTVSLADHLEWFKFTGELRAFIEALADG